MTRISEVLKAEAEASEAAECVADPLAPLPEGTSVTRGTPRTRNLQVRFSDEEFSQLSSYADARGLPLSTVVRSMVLREIAPVDDLKAALDQLESDVAAVRRKVLSV